MRLGFVRHMRRLGGSVKSGPLSSNPRHVFAVGHSLVSEAMPKISEQVTPHEWDYQLIGGAPLRVQWEEHDDPEFLVGDSVDGFVFLATGAQTDLILCENHNIAEMITWENAEGYALDWSELALAGNPGTQIYYYQCWPSANGSGPDWDWTSFAAEVSGQRRYYEQVAQHIHANKSSGPRVRIIPAAAALVALQAAIASEQIPGVTDFNDLFTDDVHLEDITWYYLACLIHAILTKRTPVGLPYNYTGYTTPAADTAVALQTLAWTVARSDRWAGIAAAPTVAVVQSAPTVDEITATEASITWSSANSDGGSVVVEHRLRWSADNGDTWTTVSPATSPHDLSGLEPVTDILLQTARRNALGWSEWSPSATFQTIEAPADVTIAYLGRSGGGDTWPDTAINDSLDVGASAPNRQIIAIVAMQDTGCVVTDATLNGVSAAIDVAPGSPTRAISIARFDLPSGTGIQSAIFNVTPYTGWHVIEWWRVDNASFTPIDIQFTDAPNPLEVQVNAVEGGVILGAIAIVGNDEIGLTNFLDLQHATAGGFTALDTGYRFVPMTGNVPVAQDSEALNTSVLAAISLGPA